MHIVLVALPAQEPTHIGKCIVLEGIFQYTIVVHCAYDAFAMICFTLKKVKGNLVCQSKGQITRDLLSVLQISVDQLHSGRYDYVNVSFFNTCQWVMRTLSVVQLDPCVLVAITALIRLVRKPSRWFRRC